jgi:hypothetical protein
MSQGFLYDFSKKLDIPPNVYAFNPSIAHWKDDLYLCTYRQFVRYPNLFQKSTTDTGIPYDYTRDKFTDPNHPWFGKCRHLRWNYKAGGGFDNTRISIIQIDTEKEEVNLIPSRMYVENKVVQNIVGQDARLLQINDNKFLLSCNNYFNGVIIKDQTNCPNSCQLISTRIIEVLDNYQIIIHPETVLCPNISSIIEKNWSFSLINRGKPEAYIAFSYGLYPIHEVFNVSIEQNQLICRDITPIIKSREDNIFSRLVKFYGEKLFFVSVSTPTVEIEPNIFLGVGHIKFIHTQITLFPNPSPLYNFYEMYKSSKTMHEIYIYMMFFYAFNIDNGDIITCSNMFLPPTTGTLCFPSGLTRKNNSDLIILSYGENDDKCMFLTYTIQELKKLLNDQNIVNKQANEVLFYMMSEEVKDMTT